MEGMKRASVIWKTALPAAFFALLLLATTSNCPAEEAKESEGKESKGKVLLVIATVNFASEEYKAIREGLEKAGFQVVVGCTVRNSRGIPDIGNVTADRVLSEVKDMELYEGMVFCGGPGMSEYSGENFPPGSPDSLKQSIRDSISQARKLVEEALRSEKAVGAICLAPAAVLAPMSAIKGRRVTGFAQREELAAFKKAGALYTGRPVEADGNLITAKVEGMEGFVKSLVAALSIPFVFPCEGYAQGLKGKGNFGLQISSAKADEAFKGSYHLAEDVWLKAGTAVKSIANGVVAYSDFSPTWTDKDKKVHWNLGNVIIIEHELSPAAKDLTHVCSVYMHLGADRKVKEGDKVGKGQAIGAIGMDKSDENGRYPAHLHFGVHKGPYLQLSPGWKRDKIEEAAAIGLPVGNPPDIRIEKGKIVDVKLAGKTTAEFTFESGSVARIGLLMQSSSPDYKPADIMGWCRGYGDKETVEEWLRPSEWIGKKG